MKLSIKEAAALCGVSLRTLRYYDQIGLVKPRRSAENGYRYYDREAMALLQQAVFYRELGLPLKEIAPLLHASPQTCSAALRAHRELLLLQKKRLEGLLSLVEQTIGGTTMTKPEVTARRLREVKQQYAQEARQRWGETPEWEAFSSRQATPQQEQAALEGAEAIFADFAALAAQGADPAQEAAQALTAKWREHISESYFPCSREVLAGLGKLYLADARFQQYLDGFGPGTARLMHDAIAVYSAQPEAED